MITPLRSKTLTASLPDGSEIVLTLIQPRGVSDTAFEEHVRRAESALAALQNASGEPSSSSVSTESVAPEPVPTPLTGKKLYVGNLPFAWTDDLLRELFAGHGTLTSVAIARFGRDGRSRGFGFVEMSTEAEAQTAIEKLHEALAGDRKIVVRLARSQESRPEGAAPTSPDAAPARRAPRPRREPQGRAQPRRNAARPARPPRPGSPPTRRGSGRPERPPRQTGISNNSGYEIYPRDSKGGFASEPTPRSAAPRPDAIDPSPYFDDTGDTENHGNRPPRRRGR